MVENHILLDYVLGEAERRCASILSSGRSRMFSLMQANDAVNEAPY